jgi:hypothetical protein
MSWTPPKLIHIPRRTVFSLIIINKAGGLIYNKTFHEGGLNKISTNDYLVLAGTFHG